MSLLNTEPARKLGIFGTYLFVLRRWDMINSLKWHAIHFDYKINTFSLQAKGKGRYIILY